MTTEIKISVADDVALDVLFASVWGVDSEGNPAVPKSVTVDKFREPEKDENGNPLDPPAFKPGLAVNLAKPDADPFDGLITAKQVHPVTPSREFAK